jgi:hypothetical protein
MNLFTPLPPPDDELSIEKQITQLADHFTDYHCINAFLNDSFTSIMSSQVPIKPDVIEGAKQCAEAMQQRGREFKEVLEHVREYAYANKRL